ncbi:hypothetical protein SAMN05216486_1034 [bacterium JGI 053]|nr:hypothetical protein SAMN05216486_1034 [bacterium JGI 053]
MKSVYRSSASPFRRSMRVCVTEVGCALACCHLAAAQTVPRMMWQLENPQYYTVSPLVALPLTLRTAPRASEAQSRIQLEPSRLQGAGASRCAGQYMAGWGAYQRRERRAGRVPQEPRFIELFRRRNEFCRIVADELVPVLAFNFSVGQPQNYVLESVDLRVSTGWGTYANNFKTGAGPWAIDAARYQLHFSNLQAGAMLNARPFAFSRNGRVLLEVSPVDYPFSNQWTIPRERYLLVAVFHFLVDQLPVSAESEPLVIEM